MGKGLTLLFSLMCVAGYGQRIYTFSTVSQAASASYMGVGSTVYTEGYYSSGDGGDAVYKVTAIGAIPGPVDSGYVYPINAGKALVQQLDNDWLWSGTYGLVCNDTSKAALNYARLVRYFNAVDSQTFNARITGCNDTLFVAVTDTLDIANSNRSVLIIRGEGKSATVLQQHGTSVAWFEFSDPSNVLFFDLSIPTNFTAATYGGIGGLAQNLTVDSISTTYTIGIDGGNEVKIAKGLQNVVEDVTPELGGELDANGNNIIDLADVTFKTGAQGGTLRTGTSNADKFELQAYDVNDGVYRTVLELDAGNDVRLQMIDDYLEIEDAADRTKVARLEVAGIASGTERTFTFPDSSGTLALLSNSTSPAGSNGSIQFKKAGVFSSSDSLHWDDTNRRLGIGLNNPSGSLHIRGIGSTSSTSSLIIEDLAGTPIMRVFDGRQIAFGSDNQSTWIGIGSIARYTAFTGINTNGIYLSALNTGFDAYVQYVGGGATSNIYQYWKSSGSIATRGQLEVGSIDGADCLNWEASAQLEVKSTTKGLLPPRMTSAQRDAISTPATGLTLYCTDCTATDASTGVMQTYNGSTWKNYW